MKNKQTNKPQKQLLPETYVRVKNKGSEIALQCIMCSTFEWANYFQCYPSVDVCAIMKTVPRFHTTLFPDNLPQSETHTYSSSNFIAYLQLCFYKDNNSVISLFFFLRNSSTKVSQISEKKLHHVWGCFVLMFLGCFLNYYYYFALQCFYILKWMVFCLSPIYPPLKLTK